MISVKFGTNKIWDEKVIIFTEKLACGRRAENEYKFHEFKEIYEGITGLKLTDEQLEQIITITTKALVNTLQRTVKKSCKICGLCK